MCYNCDMGNIETKKITKNLAWGYAEQVLTYLISFATSLVLSRILAPEIYGTITLLNVLIALLQLCMDCGLSNALIQKKDADERDFSTVFWANICLSTIMYIALFFLAPYIADFYNDSSITSILRVLGLWIVTYGVKNVQVAYVTKKLLFKKLFWASLFGTIVAGITAVYLAINGYGAWSLVALHIVDNVLDTIIIWFTLGFRPKKVFDFSRFKTLFKFGSKLFIASIADTAYNDIRSLVIGKVYSSADFAYYEKGKRYPSLVQSMFSSVVDKITFSIMSDAQDEKERMRNYAKATITIGSFLIWPMMIGLAAISKNLIVLLVTDKWINSVPYIMIFCIATATTPISNLNINVLKSLGKGNKLLIKEIIKKIVAIIIMIIAIPYGPIAIALGELIYAPMACIFNQFNGQKLIGYSIIEQWEDIFPNMFIAVVMGITVYYIGSISLPLAVVLLMQILSGILIYFVLAFILRNKALKICINYIRRGRNG